MVCLKEFGPRAFQKLRTSDLKEVAGAKLYYLIRGRNAW
jgi:hypothetical protein